MAPPLAVAPIVERVIESLRKVHRARGIEIHGDVDESVTFPGDEGDLMEIVGNLADNACKWAASRVSIRATSRPGRMRLEIRDDGPGIPDDKLELLVQRGARLDSSVEGHGIGLAIVRELVEDAYRGKLDFEISGKGTLVIVEVAAA